MNSQCVQIEKFREYYFEFSDMNSVVSFFDALGGNISKPWRRDRERENDFNSLMGDKSFCFVREKDDKLPSAGLTIFHNGGSKWYVSNIVPLELHELSCDTYNSIIIDFDNHVEMYKRPHGVKTEITNDFFTDDEVLGEEGANLLRGFSNLANKSTGSSHPSDQKRWFRFIMNTYERQNFTIDDLIDILIKQGWPERLAHKLAIEYEFAQELLKFARS
ncbi:hypothetical protein NG896_03590 [Aeromonas veronii]|uniref:hypothetical protein n=1 Tax=Aeromonas veronii TaxID=654 RepID=UPI0020905937|nr:hypothetical protein [Aeromonas veronii]MCO5341644.1 hypothetical protein [Aeromonas veronii]MCS0539445.1 hypothetical protein [Aeromonas veronii]